MTAPKRPSGAAAPSDRFRFPDRFLWGAATSAYQVEGSPLADGAGPSNWHRFSHTPGRVAGGDTGDVACDQYRRFRGDVRLMRELGLNAYRFSVSWSRILPAGTGRVNRRGLDHYERLVDDLLENGIVPFVTLFHWDLPAALEDRGGWLNPDSAGWFADYATALYRALDGRVRFWATLNEPWVVTDGGYLHGVLAPGHRDVYETPIAARNLLLAHAAGVRSYRANGRHSVGIVVNIEPKYPATRNREDLAATARAEAYMNRQYLDPVLLRRSPPEMRRMFGDAWPGFVRGELAEIGAPVDFVGINYYTRGVVRDDPGPDALPPRAVRVRQRSALHTETSWEAFPQGLTETLLRVRKRYGDVPLYVTENGAAFPDPPQARAGRVDDPLRVRYLAEHLRALAEAIRRKVDVRGYFVWSLLDNFEWSHGYSKRFGIVHVDYANQKRTPKASARFYAEVIRTHGAALGARTSKRTNAKGRAERSRARAARGRRSRPKRPRPAGR